MATETNKPATRSTRPTEDAAPLSAYSDRVETYPPERIAEFLLNNTVTREDCAAALAEVRKLGIDPATIPYKNPAGALTRGPGVPRRQRCCSRRSTSQRLRFEHFGHCPVSNCSRHHSPF